MFNSYMFASNFFGSYHFEWDFGGGGPVDPPPTSGSGINYSPANVTGVSEIT